MIKYFIGSSIKRILKVEITRETGEFYFFMLNEEEVKSMKHMFFSDYEQAKEHLAKEWNRIVVRETGQLAKSKEALKRVLAETEENN